MKWTSLNDLREKYLSFFESKGHIRLPSFSLVPNNDKSLLLINSGMAPMKKFFTGEEQPPRNRVCTCQKCIRTPDLERVGHTARHGTYFEMLGNFSFGDYFKEEAIPWAWEFLTETLEIPTDLLWPSVYEQDDEAYAIWRDKIGVPEEHIVKLGKADNFWEHGSGPCGPCSEIYFDRGLKFGCGSPDCKPGCDCDRFMEIWNNVFSQFNNDGNGNPIAINFNKKLNQLFSGLSPEKQNEILDYRLQVYLCSGTDDEKLEWFHTINIAGKQMTDQELLNANYTGPWLSDAKQYFSKKSNNSAINLAFCDNDERKTLLSENGIDANRQKLLETVLRWITNSAKSDYDDEKRCWPAVAEYMAVHRDDSTAKELWGYYENVIKWVKATFSTYRKDMKGIEWGLLYNKYGKNKYDPDGLEAELGRLYKIYDVDPDGLKKNGFYEYVLSGNRSLVWNRAFSPKQQRLAYQNQNNKCGGRCGREMQFEMLEAHHKIAFADGGETRIENCLMLCHDCHADITAVQNQKK